MIVVPNKMGIAIYSPRVDERGVPVRGAEAAQEIIKHFNFHQYDNLRGVLSGPNKKLDPCPQLGVSDQYSLEELLFAAASGDLKEVQRVAHGSPSSLFDADYDMRTALHLAASENHHRVVKFILEQIDPTAEDAKEKINPQDRWKRTPLDDAVAGNHPRVIKMLKEAGGYQKMTDSMSFRGSINLNSTVVMLKTSGKKS